MEFNTLCLILSIAAVVLCAVFFAAGVLYRKKVAEKQIGSAEEEARRIINEAIKGGESKKREMLLEAKEEIIRLKSDLDKEVRDRRSEVGRMERRMTQREEQLLGPYAARSADSRGRARPQAPSPMRTEYQRDRDRIIHCQAFRRLMNKTQVFLAPAGDHYRTRLTHTLEVSQISRTIARALMLNEDLTEAIGSWA